jgi:hypothetical protein
MRGTEVELMGENQMQVRCFETLLPHSIYKIEAVCVRCGKDLVVVIGGGSHYHLGALGLTLSMPSIKDPLKITNSTYQVPVPGHKEESLAREASLKLSQRLQINVVVTVGLHEDHILKDGIVIYQQYFNILIENICQAYSAL